MAEAQKPIVVADIREPKAIFEELELLGATLDKQTLSLGDYQLSDHLVVERKTRADFESSIMDGRLFSQLSELSSAVQRVVVVVEGEPEGATRINRKALLGAYSSVISDFGCSLFFTRGLAATAEIIHSLACHEQLAKKHPNSVYAKRKALGLPQQQRAIIEALPNVGPTLAKSLLSYFDTVENVITAPESELRNVDKIGEKTAKELRRLLTTRYKKEEDSP
jgi:Fanconi anemia group M protein